MSTGSSATGSRFILDTEVGCLKKEGVDIGKVAEAALAGVKVNHPEAVMSQRDGSYQIRLGPNDHHEISVMHPLYTPNGHVNVNGLHELQIPVESRRWVIVRVMNAGHYVEYDKALGTLRVYTRGKVLKP